MSTPGVVTATGRSMIVGRLQGTTPTQAEAKYLAIGTGAGTAATSDVGMFTESSDSRVSGTGSSVTTTTTNDTVQYVGTFNMSTENITETALFDGSTKPPSTTLSAAITTTGATSITVTSATGFPGSGNYCIQIDGEVLQVTGGQGTTTWTVTRGFNGSTAATHSNGATVTAGNNPGSNAIAAGGNMFAHSSFTALVFNSGDTYTPTFQVKFT